MQWGGGEKWGKAAAGKKSIAGIKVMCQILSSLARASIHLFSPLIYVSKITGVGLRRIAVAWEAYTGVRGFKSPFPDEASQCAPSNLMQCVNFWHGEGMDYDLNGSHPTN